MKRLLPLLIAVALLASTAAALALALGGDSDGTAKGAGRQNAGDQAKPGVSAVCVQDHPDCNDMIVGGTDGGMSDMCIADPAYEECNDTVGEGASRCSATTAPECAGFDSPTVNPGEPSSPPSTRGTAYDMTVPFNASVTDEDLKVANEIVLAFDPNADFLLQETFPPTGRARISTSVPDACGAIKAKLESIASVGDVTCTVSADPAPPCCKPDEPISSTPRTEPGVNPSESGSAPSSKSASE